MVIALRRNSSARGYDFVLSGQSKVIRTTLKLETSKLRETIELTGKVREFVGSSDVKNGLLSCFSRHTTVALVLANRRQGISKLVPEVLHATLEGAVKDKAAIIPSEPETVSAYLLSTVLGSSVMIPVEGGKCALGDWQGLYFIEMSGPREREVVMTLVGV